MKKTLNALMLAVLGWFTLAQPAVAGPSGMIPDGMGRLATQIRGRPAVLRAGAYGTNMTNVMVNGSSGGQIAWASRDPYVVTHDFTQIQIAIPLFTLQLVSNVITETNLPDAYDFAAVLEPSMNNQNYAGATQYAFTFSGAKVFHYTPGGQALPYALSDVLTLPAPITAGTKFLITLAHQNVAGASGTAVTDKMIPRVDTASNALQRYAGARSRAAGQAPLIDQTNGLDMTAGFPFFTTSAQGVTAPMTVGAILTNFSSGERSYAVNGNSIEQGANDGTGGYPYFNAAAYGDASGDALRNRGYFTRTASKLALAVSQMSRGSDSASYRLNSGNYAFRQAWLTMLNPTDIVELNAHNAIPTGVATWAANTAIAQDEARVTSAGSGYVADASCTTGGTAPSGTGAGIVDGTCSWSYIGPNDISGASQGMNYVSQMRRLLRLDRAAAPKARFIIPTLTPDGLSNRTASNYSYDSGSGNFTITLPDVSDLVVNGNVRLTGISTSGFNTSGVTPISITAIDTVNKTITVVRNTGLSAPSGTLVVNTGWTSVAGQQPTGAFAAGTSFRSWINRFDRAIPNNVFGNVVVFDLAKYVEAGAPTTPGTETAAWKALNNTVNGSSINQGGIETTDGTHPGPQGNDDVSTQAANDNALAPQLKAANQ